MPTIQLPELNNIYWKKSGNNNIVKHLLSLNLEVEYFFISIHRSYAVIAINGDQYCITVNRYIIPDEFDYILLSDKRATEEKLCSGNIKLKTWLKHPLLIRYTTEDVINSWKNDFSFIEEDIDAEINGLREPQIAALYSILSHLKVSEDIGTVVMPTGTGKTETMLSTMVANKSKKVLVTVPSDALRNQIADKFYTFGLLKKFGVIGENSLYPKVGTIYNNFSNSVDFEEFIQECNVIVTTMNTLTLSQSENLNYLSEECSSIFIDEAHHVEANSWNKVRRYFDKKKVLQFTATPFRNDRKRLDGKIIFNFSLKKAQQQGYFKPINFLPVREYDFEKADFLIAEKGVEILRKDLAESKNHILMARCENKTRAGNVFEIYKKYKDLYPVLIHSSVSGKKDILKNIIAGKHKIIVAVNMLGEGFDLPQLKIATFHDIRKSLPVTLQFAGRFTRTSFDDNLGNATFVANIANSQVEEELSELYSQDSDWNFLLSKLSGDKIGDKIEFDEFIDGFQNIKESQIPFQNIKFSVSTVVYKNTDLKGRFNLNNFKEGLSNYDDLEYKFSDYNPKSNTLVIITASRSSVEWVDFKEINGLEWKLYVLYYNTNDRLLYIHASDKSGLYKEIADAILYEQASLINQTNVYRAFYDIKRVSLNNVGLKEYLNKNIRFTMRVGADIEKALSIAEQRKGEKAFVFGAGFEEGEKVTLGCSYKGRIWSHLKGGILEFTKWCDKIGKKLIDSNIDANQVLKYTLIPKATDEIPDVSPVYIDWDDSLYVNIESRVSIIVDDSEFSLANCSLRITDSENIGYIIFEIEIPSNKIQFQQKLFTIVGDDGEEYYEYRFVKIDKSSTLIKIGTKTPIDIIEYFYNYPPTIWFADGSSLTGNNLKEIKDILKPYPIEELISWNWDGVDIGKESQHVLPLLTDSIQYNVIGRLMESDYDIIYDDDGSGEIADIVTIKEYEEEIIIRLYHLKYAKEGKISARIDNFYEVCGQAQKSIHWKHRNEKEFFNHLIRRKTKTKSGNERSRIEKGTVEELERLMKLAKNRKPVMYEIFIVQPSLSPSNTSEDIMMLLGVTDNYLKDVAGVNLTVIVNE